MGDVITDPRKFEAGWRGGLPETPCGSGSRLINTTKQRNWIPVIIAKYGISTVADIGAGDMNWIRLMLERNPASRAPGKLDLCGAEYYAFDLVPRRRIVQKMDIVKTVPERYDLVMLLWVLNHLPAALSERAFQNVKASGSRYMLFVDRPKWYKDWPPCLRDLPALERVVLNKKNDALLLVDLKA